MNARRSHLIVGGDSLLGSALGRRLRSLGESVIETTRRSTVTPSARIALDLTRSDAFEIPDSVGTAYLMASITNQLYCASHPEESRTVNVRDTLALARKLIRARIHVVFISTNLVFDGTIPFVKESASHSPRTTYGQQKAEVEAALLESDGEVSIVRLTKVLAPSTSIVHEWVKKLRASEPVQPFTNFTLAPLSVDFVTEALAAIVRKRASGVVHISPSSQMGYLDVANYIAEKLGRRELVKPTTSHRAGRVLEHVSEFVTLDTTRLVNEIGCKVPPAWEMVKHALKSCFAEAGAPTR